MRILFHTSILNFRGTAVAVADFAKFNQEILGNESVICYDSDIPYQRDMGNEPSVIETLSSMYPVVGHNGSNINEIVDQHKIDLTYIMRSGDLGWVPDNCKTAIHAVFQLYQNHGDRFAYISEWLAYMTNLKHGTQVPSVPLIVNLPEPTGDFKGPLNIASDQTVIGRHGGLYTFDLPWVKQTIMNLLEERNDYTFVFLGTQPWTDHPKVKFIGELNDLQAKSNFINTCDAMIHARSNGESFGLAVAEFLSMNKPVISWNGGNDQNHMAMLAGSGTLYNTPQELKDILLNFRDIKQDWTARIADYRPVPTMKRFKEVFIC
jgi:hypothetical protein